MTYDYMIYPRLFQHTDTGDARLGFETFAASRTHQKSSRSYPCKRR